MLDRIIFGDNQFFGINHMSEEKAQAQFERFRNVGDIIDGRGVVGTGDGDEHRVEGGRIRAVGRRQRIGQGNGLTGQQEVEVGTGDAVTPGRAAGGVRIDDAGSEAAFEQTREGRIDAAAAPHRSGCEGGADVDHVGGVDVIEGHRTTGR